MNANEFAAYVGASPQRARTWFRSGRLPGVRRDALGRWVVDDPKAAAAAWRKHADHAKSSPAVIKRAVESGRAAPPRAPAPSPAAVDPALVAACNDLTAAFMLNLWLKVSSLAGFDELEEADRSELASVFATALDGMVRYGLPVNETPFPPPFDPQFLAEALA